MASLLYLLFLYIISPYWDYSCLISEIYPILDDTFLAIVLILKKTCNKLEYKTQYFSTISVRGIRSKANSNNDRDLPLAERELRALHYIYIKELYKDRKAPVKAFDDSVLDTCYDLDNEKRIEFLKSGWVLTKGCIFIIQYKHDPLIYYIGRTTVFKRRFYNHLKAETRRNSMSF